MARALESCPPGGLKNMQLRHTTTRDYFRCGACGLNEAHRSGPNDVSCRRCKAWAPLRGRDPQVAALALTAEDRHGR